jgi:hypothetical protein
LHPIPPRLRLVLRDLRQKLRFFPLVYLHPLLDLQTAGPLPRHGDDLTLRLYERLFDDERLWAPLVLLIII